ncbi:hypothetical protein BBJ29_007117 [Phytophthora kernoviae]|uniref:EF-hand domain-containing protein n=1 Tax=Phytophthora kernoviae TaxID=325452 RepID=A0A3F2REZ3_9STRA|nr:hypothetical protein BBP00_00008582 [Phytophthora kernoviae]RLN57465.1 hypothetical protein BBJ29_007117 [Phytophthora kernoviae]
MLEKNGGEKLPVDVPNSTAQGVPTTPLLSPKSPLSSTTSSPTKPVFLKTWEEREHERRLEKEISKAQRIEEEKQRLNQRVLERQQRDDYEALISKLAERRNQRAAKRIQMFFREFLNSLHAQQNAEINRAATLIQTAWKRFVHVKEYPHRLETGKRQKELALMAQDEQALRLWLARMEKEVSAEPLVVPTSEDEDDDAASAVASPSKEVVDALVSTWRRLHRVFVLAHTTKGIDYSELFSQIDLRKDDVLDRAELRLGARSFGVRLNRQVTRAAAVYEAAMVHLTKLGKSTADYRAFREALVHLFRGFDVDNDGQLDILTQFCGSSPLPQHPAARIAKGMMELLDLNANGVATLKEWLTFAQHEDSEGNNDDPVVIEAMRKALKDSESDDPEHLVVWFSGLPGAMQIATTRPGGPTQVKIRVTEFKNALRAKLGGARTISLRTIDRVVESIDKDSSGWITTNELYTWAFPTRDLEEILRLAIRSWQPERQRETSPTIFTTNVYKRFDTDNNGSIAVRELISGFGSFGVRLTEYEARVLMIAFDLDGDGCWSKSEFIAFVDKLFPIDLVVEPLTVVAPTHESAITDIDTHEVRALDDSEYSDDELAQSGSSDAVSSPVYTSEDEVVVRPVEYSEDFDD